MLVIYLWASVALIALLAALVVCFFCYKPQPQGTVLNKLLCFALVGGLPAPFVYLTYREVLKPRLVNSYLANLKAALATVKPNSPTSKEFHYLDAPYVVYYENAYLLSRPLLSAQIFGDNRGADRACIGIHNNMEPGKELDPCVCAIGLPIGTDDLGGAYEVTGRANDSPYTLASAKYLAVVSTILDPRTHYESEEVNTYEYTPNTFGSGGDSKLVGTSIGPAYHPYFDLQIDIYDLKSYAHICTTTVGPSEYGRGLAADMYSWLDWISRGPGANDGKSESYSLVGSWTYAADDNPRWGGSAIFGSDGKAKFQMTGGTYRFTYTQSSGQLKLIDMDQNLSDKAYTIIWHDKNAFHLDPEPKTGIVPTRLNFTRKF